MAIRLKKHNIIFIHIPKCGGTSVCHSLKAEQKVGKIHSSIEELNKQKIYAKEYLLQVRNPYTRFYSHYHFLIEWNKKRASGKLPTKGNNRSWYKKSNKRLINLGFDGWVNLLDSEEDRKQFIQDSGTNPFRTQSSFHSGTTRPVHIFKMEEGGIWEYLRKLDYNVKSVHKKRSSYKTVKGYTQKQSDIVYRYFKEDFDRYNYKKSSQNIIL